MNSESGQMDYQKDCYSTVVTTNHVIVTVCRHLAISWIVVKKRVFRHITKQIVRKYKRRLMTNRCGE